MTKKSYARQQRDANKKDLETLKKTNTCWDDLKKISDSCFISLHTANNNLVEIYKTDRLINFIPKKTEVKVALRGLSQDLNMFTSELVRINALHKDKSGGFTEDEDLSLSLNLFEEYATWQTKYEAVVMPTVLFLLEQAELALQAGSNADAATDPNVVTDVVVKEPAPTTAPIIH